MFTLFSMLNVFISLTTLVVVAVALLLILVVLMQRPKQEGLGATFGAGMTDQMFGAQTTNVLQKATVWLGITFFSATLLLAILTNRKNTSSTIVTDAPAAVEESAGADGKAAPSLADQLNKAEADAAKPAVTAKPAQKPEGSLLDQLKESGAATGDKAKDAAGSATEAVKEGASNAGDTAKGVANKATDAAKGAGNAVKEETSNTAKEALKEGKVSE